MKLQKDTEDVHVNVLMKSQKYDKRGVNTKLQKHNWKCLINGKSTTKKVCVNLDHKNTNKKRHASSSLQSTTLFCFLKWYFTGSWSIIDFGI